MRFRPKLILINLLDAGLLNLALLGALALRFDGVIPTRFLQSFLHYSVFYTAGMLLIINLAGINRSIWRYAGVPTLLVLVRTLAVGYAGALVLNFIPTVHLFPTGVVIVSWILATGLILASRLAWKIVRSPSQGPRRRGHRILIAGAGDVGVILARELQRSHKDLGHPIGFVDDDPNKHGRRIETLPVLGATFDIPRLIVEKKIAEVVIAAPSAPSRLIRQVVQICQDAGVSCRTVPALSDYISGKEALGQVREVQIEDLLGREPVTIDLEGIRSRVEGRTILVTGAGGSIGSELCRQLARFRPDRLVALDHCENRLCYLGLDLSDSHPECGLVQVVGDIRDARGVMDLMAAYRPNMVFHAAAHKHVHFLEQTPREAILNNILGTRNVARAAVAAEVETFVLISTDKAVNPSNIMGASKRGCEILLQSMVPDSATALVAVRFGNVLGSDGSVVPIFKRQLARGGPLTVTHPDVRRYFMTIPEASQLVIQAAQFGSTGDLFVLDMGEQIRILDVAEQLIRLSGLRPGLDVPIRFVGLRPGEKLEEELLTHTERMCATQHRKILRLELDPVDPGEVARKVDAMAILAQAAPRDEIQAALADFVPEYQVRTTEPLPREAKPARRLESRSLRSAAPLPATRPEPRAKRLVDVAASLLLLGMLLPVVGVLLTLYRMVGRGPVRFRREEMIGQNRRRVDRRGHGAEVPIDRRFDDRRVRALPGRPFVCYRIEWEREEQNTAQRCLESGLRRYRLDRVLQLWNVARGRMSLVGPAARLVSDSNFTQDWTSTWIFARRPGLTGPGTVLAQGTPDALRRQELYDGYYARFGGPQLDADTLFHAALRLLRGEDPITAGMEFATQGALGQAGSGEEGTK